MTAKDFKKKIEHIISDLMNEGTYSDFLSLQNPKDCNQYSIFLEDELKTRFR